MKICPSCQQVFDDRFTNCPNDGSFLAPASFEGRAVKKGGSVLAIVVVVGMMIVIGSLLVIGGGVAGFFYLQSSRVASVTDEEAENHLPPDYQEPVITNLPEAESGRQDEEVDPEAPPPPTKQKTPEKPVTERSPAPPPEESKPRPKRISGGVLNGKAVSLPKPQYPPAARAVRASGAVSVQVLVDENGRVVSARAVSGHPLLRPSAVAAARQAKFAPTLLAGQPVRVSGIITYNFVAP